MSPSPPGGRPGDGHGKSDESNNEDSRSLRDILRGLPFRQPGSDGSEAESDSEQPTDSDTLRQQLIEIIGSALQVAREATGGMQHDAEQKESDGNEDSSTCTRTHHGNDTGSASNDTEAGPPNR